MKDAYHSNAEPHDPKDIIKVALIENARFYADMRFKQLTLLIGYQTASAYAAFTSGDSPVTKTAPAINAGMAVAGISMIFTAVLWVMEIRSTLYRDAAIKAAGIAWPHPRPRWRWINATTAVLGLHIVIYAGWLWYGISQGMGAALNLAFGVLGLVLIAYSVVN